MTEFLWFSAFASPLTSHPTSPHKNSTPNSHTASTPITHKAFPPRIPAHRSIHASSLPYTPSHKPHSTTHIHRHAQTLNPCHPQMHPRLYSTQLLPLPAPNERGKVTSIITSVSYVHRMTNSKHHTPIPSSHETSVLAARTLVTFSRPVAITSRTQPHSTQKQNVSSRHILQSPIREFHTNPAHPTIHPCIVHPLQTHLSQQNHHNLTFPPSHQNKTRLIPARTRTARSTETEIQTREGDKMETGTMLLRHWIEG